MTQTYKQQINHLGDFLLKHYNNETVGEMGLEPTAVEIAIRLLDHGSTVDGILFKLNRKEW